MFSSMLSMTSMNVPCSGVKRPSGVVVPGMKEGAQGGVQGALEVGLCPARELQVAQKCQAA